MRQATREEAAEIEDPDRFLRDAEAEESEERKKKKVKGKGKGKAKAKAKSKGKAGGKGKGKDHKTGKEDEELKEQDEEAAPASSSRAKKEKKKEHPAAGSPFLEKTKAKRALARSSSEVANPPTPPQRKKRKVVDPVQRDLSSEFEKVVERDGDTTLSPTKRAKQKALESRLKNMNVISYIFRFHEIRRVCLECFWFGVSMLEPTPFPMSAAQNRLL